MALIKKAIFFFNFNTLSQCNKHLNKNVRNIYLTKCLEVPKVVPFKLSDIGEGIKEVVVKEWFIKEGDKVNQFDNICEVQSDKASVTITSRYDGIVKKLHYDVENTALVGNPLIDIQIDEDSTSKETEEIITKNVPEQSLEPKKEIDESTKHTDYSRNTSIASCIPSVRRLAKQYHLNLNEIKGTGKRGRILKEDIINYVKVANPKVAAEIIGITDAVKTSSTSTPLKGFQKPMFKAMTESLTIPHFILCDEISISKLRTLRKEINSGEELDLKLSFMPFIIKAVSLGLREFPILNSSISSDEESIQYKSNHNIGIAMDTKIGLAVPVIKNVDNMSILNIAKELNRLMANGKEGSFSPDDLKDATFTISNIGSLGGTYASPIISKPQVAIIALGASKLVPKFDDDMKVIPDHIINLSAAADHRIIDGATMANFINIVKRNIENPHILLIQ